jgi:hypothetical protein
MQVNARYTHCTLHLSIDEEQEEWEKKSTTAARE